MDVSTLQLAGLLAVGSAMIITLYDMGAALKPVACAECPHCRAAAAAEAREQDRLRREYAQRVGLPTNDDEDDRKIG